MLILLGVLFVFGSIIVGYLLEGGNLLVLLQPAEIVIIGGSVAGVVLISSPARNLRMLMTSLKSIGRQTSYTKQTYLLGLKLLYTLFQFGRRMGAPALEPHIEAPQKSELFREFKRVLSDKDALNFICDSFRIVISAGVSGEEVESLMKIDMDVQRSGRQHSLRIIGNVADALPGLGIVAAVLGVVVTMQSLGGAATEIGHKVAAALVGTFLGILMCYGLIGPIGHHLECLSKSQSEYLQVLRAAIGSYFCGASPLVAAESGRRSIPLDLRPSFDAMEKELRRVRPSQAAEHPDASGERAA